MTFSRVLLVAGVLAGSSAFAQAASKFGGRCGSADWICVAQCIDVTCVDACLAKRCEKSLDKLITCAKGTACGADDSRCIAQACGTQCEKSFEPAGKSPEVESPNPCIKPTSGAGKVPKEVVGTWKLEAASIKAEDRDSVSATPGKELKPRPDYGRVLHITPNGCFSMETKLDDATLGKGNGLEVRSWGNFVVKGKKTVDLVTKDGQAVGPVCGKQRAIPLPASEFQTPNYEFDVELDVLTLTAKTASKQTFQFARQTPEDDQKK